MEPTTTVGGSAVLAKYGIAIAGFGGAILSLSFLKGLTRKQAVAAVLTGFGCAYYWTAPLAWWLGQKYQMPTDDRFLCGVAFTIGLLAMNIIPGLKAAAERFLPVGGA